MFFRHVGAGCQRARPRSTAEVAALAALMVVVFTFALAIPSPSASAGTYDVEICGVGNGSPGTADGLTVSNNPGSDGWMYTIDNCSLGGPQIWQGTFMPSGGSSYTWNGDGSWTLQAPPSTSLAWVQMRQTFQGFGSYFTWDLTTPDGRLLARQATWQGTPVTSGVRSYVVNAPSVTGRFYCLSSAGCSGGGTSAVIDQFDARIEDDHQPTFDGAPAGSLLSSSSVSGVRGIAFSASDLGSGIYSASLLIDGTAVKTVQPDSNGGLCARPFTVRVPCQLQESGSISIDTTTLREGEHQVQVAVTDATGTNTTVSTPTTIVVDNVPLPSGGLPSVEGSATTGTTLIAKPGVWDGATGTYGFQWQRCDADGSGCEHVASGNTYVLTLADVGSRLRVRVVASNSAGEQASALSALTAVVQEASTDAQGRSESPGIAPSAPSSALRAACATSATLIADIVARDQQSVTAALLYVAMTPRRQHRNPVNLPR